MRQQRLEMYLQTRQNSRLTLQWALAQQPRRAQPTSHLLMLKERSMFPSATQAQPTLTRFSERLPPSQISPISGGGWR